MLIQRRDASITITVMLMIISEMEEYRAICTAAIFLYIATEIIFLVFLSLMFLKGLKQPEVFLGIEEDNAIQKYERTLLPQ